MKSKLNVGPKHVKWVKIAILSTLDCSVGASRSQLSPALWNLSHKTQSLHFMSLSVLSFSASLELLSPETVGLLRSSDTMNGHKPRVRKMPTKIDYFNCLATARTVQLLQACNSKIEDCKDQNACRIDGYIDRMTRTVRYKSLMPFIGNRI